MPSATIRNAGFTAQFAPQIKRATATLSDGSVVMIVPDTNIAALAGTDATGTAKFAIYKSDTTRTTWTLNLTSTLSPVSSSTTVAAIMSMVLDSGNNMHLVYAGTDGSLNYRYFDYTAGVYTLNVSQQVSASSAVTRRYRAVDIDVTNAGGTSQPAIIVYESKASAGPSAYTRVYIRNSDFTTWRKAYEYDHATGAGGNIQIYDGSEDVSISWNAAAIVSNVGQLMIYFTRVGFFYDHGDQISEIQYNVSTGTDLSATVLGTWPQFNQDVAAGTRRGWVFKTTSNLWQIAFVAGSRFPTFMTGRLTHGAYSAPGLDKTVITSSYQSSDFSGVTTRISPMQPQINFNVNKFNAVGCVYADNRVMFGYVSANISLGGATQYGLSATVFRYPDASNFSANYIDTQMRPLDNNFFYGEQPIGVYGGGNNRNQAGDLKFNFLGLYGYSGNTADTSHKNIVRAIIDTFYDPPTNVAPSLSVTNDAPTLQARVQNTALYPNIKGKIEFNLARDAAFTSDLRSVVEPDVNYRYFGSTTAAVPPPVSVSIALSGVGSQKLYSGTWYMRSRVVSDLGQVSSWSANTQFTVSHAPSALTRGPNAGDLISFGSSGNVTYTWTMSDTEPTDVQSAYRLIVQRLDTGTTVTDTGKVTSSVNSVINSLSNTLLDIPLQWSVALWDSDDVQGAFSNPVAFMVSQPPAVRVTTPTDASTVATAAPALGWSNTFLGSRTQKAFRISAITAQAFDVYSRTVSSSWGSTTDGKAYTIIGTASDYSANGTLGIHTHNATNTKHISLLPSLYTDTDQEIEISTSALSAGAGAQRVGLVGRYVDISNYFVSDVQFNPDSSMGIRIMSVIGGSEATLGTVVLSGFTYVAAVRYKIRFKISGTSLKSKVWLASGSQPGYWNVDVISGLLPNAGNVGPYSRIDSGTTTTLPTNATFDNYSLIVGDPLVVGTSNWIQSSVNTYNFPANVLVNNSYYILQTEVMDTAGMIGSDSSRIQTVWTAPTDGVSSVTTDDYGATINWTNSGIDVTFISWRVYRRYMVPASVDLDDGNTRNTWVLLYETRAVQSNYSFKDYLIPNGKATDYVVVQVADRFGSIVESPISSFSTVTSTSDRYYFIPTIPIGTIAAYQAGNVTDDTYTDEVESETLHVIKRGRQVQIGDDLGVVGTLTIQLRGTNTRVDREFLQRLASTKNLGTWMKNPFGDVRLVKFGNIQVKPLAGTGMNEMSDLTIPYTELATDVPITRL